jgi:plastocyanin
VGEAVTVTATYGGKILNGGGEALTWTISDPGVIVGSAFSATGTSVGGATLTVTYAGSTATLGFTVHAKDGLSALVSDITDGTTGTSAWRPPEITVAAGSTVEFNISNNGVSHTVVFDAVAGAPDNVPAGPAGFAADRTFPTAGSFIYKCSIHGETGVVNVLRQ